PGRVYSSFRAKAARPSAPDLRRGVRESLPPARRPMERVAKGIGKDQEPEMTASELTYRLPARAIQLFVVLAILGGVTLVAGLYWEPERTWSNVLLLSYYLVGLGLGGLLFVALHHVTGARWSEP